MNGFVSVSAQRHARLLEARHGMAVSPLIKFTNHAPGVHDGRRATENKRSISSFVSSVRKQIYVTRYLQIVCISKRLGVAPVPAIWHIFAPSLKKSSSKDSIRCPYPISEIVAPANLVFVRAVSDNLTRMLTVESTCHKVRVHITNLSTTR